MHDEEKGPRHEDFAGLIVAYSVRYVKAHPWVELDDLIQEGYLAFLQARDRFDPDRGTQFSTWLTCSLRNWFYIYSTRQARLRGWMSDPADGWEDSLPDPEPDQSVRFEFTDQMKELTQEAQEVADIIINGPEEVFQEIGAELRHSVWKLRANLKRWLRKKGWSGYQVDRVIRELREFCRA
jgi:RNA polymerase sigma factor (sigma-70 family)